MTVTRARRRLASDDRREEILAAALRMFATRDAATLTVEDLARAADASAALVYHYFGGKHGLAEAALGAAAEQLVGVLEVDTDAHALVQLDDGLRIYLDFLAEHPASWSALLRAGFAGQEPGASLAGQVDDHAVGLAVRALGFSTAPPMLEAALRGWLDLVKGCCLRWLDAGGTDRDGLHALLAGAFLGCVQAAAGADAACQPALDALTG